MSPDDMHPLRILHLEDDPFFADMAEDLLKSRGMRPEIRRAENFSVFEKALRGKPFDLILSDHEFPGGDGLKALALCRRACPHVPFIFLSGRIGEELAIESLKNGAADYVLKANMSRFLPAVVRTLDAFREAAALRAAEARIRRDRANLHGLIENTLDAIWSMDADFKVLAFNSAASLLRMKLTGQPMAEGAGFLEDMPSAWQARWRKAMERAGTQERFQEEYELEWMGRVYALEVGFNPILSGREVAGVAVFARDVSARKLAENAAARLDRQRERLANAYRRMRIPLRALERAAGLLGRAAGPGEMQRPVTMLMAAARQLNELHARASGPEDGMGGRNPGSAEEPIGASALCPVPAVNESLAAGKAARPSP
jgi:PAS domain S-box-containing protein